MVSVRVRESMKNPRAVTVGLERTKLNRVPLPPRLMSGDPMGLSLRSTASQKGSGLIAPGRTEVPWTTPLPSAASRTTCQLDFAVDERLPSVIEGLVERGRERSIEVLSNDEVDAALLDAQVLLAGDAIPVVLGDC